MLFTATVSGLTLEPLACSALNSVTSATILLFITAMLVLASLAVELLAFVDTTVASDVKSVWFAFSARVSVNADTSAMAALVPSAAVTDPAKLF